MDMYKLFKNERDQAMHLMDELILDEYMTAEDKIKKRDRIMFEFDTLLDHMQVLADALYEAKKELKEAESLLKKKTE